MRVFIRCAIDGASVSIKVPPILLVARLSLVGKQPRHLECSPFNLHPSLLFITRRVISLLVWSFYALSGKAVSGYQLKILSRTSKGSSEGTL